LISDVISIASAHIQKRFHAISISGEMLDGRCLFIDWFVPDGIFVLHSKVVLPDSVAAEWDDVISSWLNAEEPLTLKQRSYIANDASGFHRACDGVANTLVVVKSTEGNVFGGFSVAAWDSSRGFKADPTGLSFVFVLKNSFGDKPTRFRLNNKDKAISCSPLFGPSFGSTFCVWDSLHSYVQFNPKYSSYVDALGRGVAGFVSSGEADCREFQVASYEVWAAAGPPTPCA
jgi:hypothetical protein